jgi:hypothetical protein
LLAFFPRVFGTISGLGEISVGAFDERVLVAVAELLREAKVAVVMVLFGFSRSLGAVGIVFGDSIHDDYSCL